MKADTHVHTKYSVDSTNEPAEILRRLRDLDGVCVTDHGTMKGALAVKKLNKNKDFKVIAGCEVKTSVGEIIGYNLNSEIRAKEPLEAIDEVHSQGGVVCVPHPFDLVRKEAIDRKALYEIARKVDLIEGVNGRTFWLFNCQARSFAERFKKPVTGGSDAHFPSELGCVYTEFDDIRKPERVVCRRLPALWLLNGARSKMMKIRGKAV
jgi:predicted metal-dependent phosphoesterase TrpH